MTFSIDIEKIDWVKGEGLIPAVIQEQDTKTVLMLGYMNKEALEETLRSKRVTFYSRTKKRLWQKGETSGHFLDLEEIHLDCDQDTLLIEVSAYGPTCHLGTKTCFGNETNTNFSILSELCSTIKERHLNPVKASYTAALFEEGLTRIAQKVGEEGVEVALAGATQSPTLAEECADLFYHTLVLLEATNTDIGQVMDVLKQRARKK